MEQTEQIIRNTVAHARSEIEAAIHAARAGLARRGDSQDSPVSSSRRKAQESIAQARQRFASLENKVSHPALSPALSIQDLHTVERLLSHVRHSIVRVCFYNLKLLCPSLADEYDAQVREQVQTNIGQLGMVRQEITDFFAQPLSKGNVKDRFPKAFLETTRNLSDLIACAEPAKDTLENPGVRKQMSEKVPPRIDAIMTSLQAIQAELDAAKVSMTELVEESLRLSRDFIGEHHLKVEYTPQAVPKVFGIRAQLLNACAEVMVNAAKYAHGGTLRIDVRPSSDKRFAEVLFESKPPEVPDASNYTPEGTGRGLDMVAEVIETQHLGIFAQESLPGGAYKVKFQLPVRLIVGKGNT